MPKTNTFSKEDLAILRGLGRVLDHFRELDADMQVQFIQTLLIIATKEGETMRDIREDLELSSSAMTRNVQYWLDWRSKDKPGHDFVETYDDHADRRYLHVRLKPKGRNTLAQVISTMRRTMNAGKAEG